MSEINTYVSPDEVLADLLTMVLDVDYRWRSRGFYLTQIKYFLEELGFDTLFDTQDRDIEIPANGRIPIPSGLFDIKEMWVFSGTCTPTGRQRVYNKRGYINDGEKTFSPEMDNVSGDPFSANKSNRESALFYAVQNGMIMLSPSCLLYEKVKVVFSGTFGEIGAVPFIPMHCRRACLDWTAAEICKLRMAENPEPFAGLYNMYNQASSRPFEGTYDTAKRRIARMSPKQREDYKQYWASTSYK